MNAVMNYDNAFRSYKSAQKKAAWSMANSSAWEVVSRYLANQIKARKK